MFSKLIAFSAIALALVNAAPNSPSQNPLITVSGNMNITGAAVSNQVHSAGNIESGRYRIFNNLAGDTTGGGKPVFVKLYDEDPGTVWSVDVNSDGSVIIWDHNGLPLGSATGRVTPEYGLPESVHIEPSGLRTGDSFIIRTERDGKVWTPIPMPADLKYSTIVPERYERNYYQTWIFEKSK
ncbi:hypothetical protein DFH08DRAFT_825981 [Mycena albidolilacea]|uniref:Uncharacterized protein n=1 Tax=Mycena albidolilacea TaxID=1033008 RepID=A0AAD6Z0Y4_9AGAR|nr:hypothetical protein DFH08DRAFT_825981 [Mycena albidolilacea]